MFVSSQTGADRKGPSQPAIAAPPAIVIGFVGGYVPHDSAIHGGVQLAERLRKEYPSGVAIEVFENHRGEQAYREIRRLLDADHDGILSDKEKRDARIVVYGHSWGGSEAIHVARRLEADGVPVLLTVQVDSVRKVDEDDSVIPPNVAQAVNFYQTDGLVHGQTQIRAADPARTRIMGNFRYEYGRHPIECSGYPWYARAFVKPHIEIECDPAVLKEVEVLIRSALARVPTANSARRHDRADTYAD